MRAQDGAGRTITAFSFYLRTGRRIAPDIEVKFNPWHDEDNGRFTFVGQGRYYSADGAQGDGGSFGGGGASGDWATAEDRRLALNRESGVPDRRHLHPRHPNNHSVHVVEAGESLSRIAALRRGLKASDLAWLNAVPMDRPLRVGQRIMLPHQAYLDASREAKNKFLGLAAYMDAHGGKLPPHPANPPSIIEQILDSKWRRETRNAYDFHIDPIERSRKIFGQMSLAGKPARSRSAQANAGKPDRRTDDDGGHFIAARFNGPSDGFNHFAQNANFNRGAYRVMEDGWARDLRAGRKLFVVIEPFYGGASKRPNRVIVTWTIDGKEYSRDFSNEAKGKADEAR